MQYAKDPVVDRSLQHSVRDGMANSAMVGGAETYLAAFALFFKASASQVMLLSTLPALLGALGQVLAAWMTRSGGRRKPLVVAGGILQALVWLPLLAMPLLLPDYAKPLRMADYAVPLLMVLITVYFFAGQLTTPLWTAWMGDLVPAKKRGRYFAYRSRLTTLTGFIALVVGGVGLHVADVLYATAWGFAALFAGAFIARLVSTWQISRMHEPERRTAQDSEVELDRNGWNKVRRSGALWFSSYVMLMQGSVAIAGPLIAVYMLNVLEFSYMELMLTTGGTVLVQYLTLNYWGRIADIFGNRLLLSVSSLMMPLLPALWLLSDNFWFLLAVQSFGGVAWGAFALSSGNLLYELVPSKQRATYSAFHNVLMAGGIFAGGMLGLALLQVVPSMAPVLGGSDLATPLLTVFLLSAVARLAVSVLLLRRVQEARPPRRHLTTHAYVLRVMRARRCWAWPTKWWPTCAAASR
ncbi:hypothetical protein CAI21_21250 [Alkalilimnicola ehrlichii]|uniref:MFS transporter n=1 Tax=Alkalilimnicola ehrlichii TaxID=351052 RepID=UPI000E2EC652|nr:MFS transporter [Alkalilimnicola ehrlichii]RFA24519.1 hypothetical protein CAI21_21250 [Alkalilimnicola ehrlichii]